MTITAPAPTSTRPRGRWGIQPVIVDDEPETTPRRSATPVPLDAGSGALRMLVGHPSRLTGEVLARSLGSTGDFAAVKLVHGFETLLEAATAMRPHVVLVAGVAGHEEVEVARQIATATRCGVVVVATEPSRAVVDSTLKHGNISLLSHHASLTHLMHAVRGAALGCSTIDTSFSPAVDGAGACLLTPREREVLLMTSEGHPIKDIATSLFLTPGTVRNISSAAIKKLQARNRHDAARLARSKGWL